MTGFLHTLEAGGHAFTCQAKGWVVWETTEPRARAAATEHAKKCKHHTPEGQQ
ncbi:hypothetical protein [Nocardioides jensenii]|uniref:hypothetical protein n=1 Tax=Nocardioides jensenii TaxID=1843 RepID=UPI000A4BA21B|nr:hypothetical protein [Nocardioides jensenii]